MAGLEPIDVAFDRAVTFQKINEKIIASFSSTFWPARGFECETALVFSEKKRCQGKYFYANQNTEKMRSFIFTIHIPYW